MLHLHLMMYYQEEKLQRMWGNILLLKKLKKHQRKQRVQDINHELLV